MKDNKLDSSEEQPTVSLPTPTLPLRIEGLPEGLEIVRYGEAGPDDIVLSEHNMTSRGRPFTYGLIVRVLDGYAHRYDILTGSYRIIKLFETPRILMACFAFTTEDDEQVAQKLLPTLRGFQYIEGQP